MGAGGTGVNGVPYAVLINDSGEAKIAVVDHESYFELSTVGVLEPSQIYP